MPQYDLLVLDHFVPDLTYAAVMQLFGEDGSQACTGVLKLAQRWVLEFLTEVGSQINRPTRGCGFLTAFRYGQMQTEAAVEAQFRFAESAIVQNLLSDDTDATPLDETFAGATLDAITILPGTLQLSVTINSAAGSSRTVVLPVGTVDITQS